MPKIFTTGNHNIPSQDNCSGLSPVKADLREHETKSCQPDEPDICLEFGRRKKFGHDATADPMQSGSIINGMLGKTNHINRFSNALRGCEQGVAEMFSNLVVLDEDGKAFPVPLFKGPQEKAVVWLMSEHARKDNTLVVDRPALPLLALHHTDIQPAPERYIYHKAKTHHYGTEVLERDTVFGVARGVPVNMSFSLYAWTYFMEDMLQIIEQIMLKITPMAYISIHGVPWEVGVKLDSVANNIDIEPGDQNARVVKYQFNLTAETYIPQPIVRNKTVLKMRTDYFNSVDEKQMNTVYDRQEISTND